MAESTKARVVGFNHVALEVGDIEEALAFYGRSQLDYLFMDDVVVAHSDDDLAAALATGLAVSGS